MVIVDMSPDMGRLGPGGDAPIAPLRRLLVALFEQLPPGDSGLMIYADEPYLVTPFTSDRATLAHPVSELDPKIMPVQGDRPERALAYASRLLSARGGGDIVWITARQSPLPPFPENDARSGVRLFTLHLAHAEDSSLSAQSRTLQGDYFRVGIVHAEALQWLSRRLQERRSLESVTLAGTEAVDVGGVLILPLLLLAIVMRRRAEGALGIIAVLMMGFSFSPVEARAEQPARDDRLAWGLVSMGLWKAAAVTFEDSGWRAVAQYRSGNYAAAAETLAGAQDPVSLHNRGNALARIGRFPEAMAAYEMSLSKRENEDTRFNLELLRSQGQPPQEGQQGPLPRNNETEAGRVAKQWLQAIPDESHGLLARRLRREHERRRSGEGAQPW